MTERTGDHDPREDPVTCAEASLHELAGAQLTSEERTEALRHGAVAVRELERRIREARAWARAAYWKRLGRDEYRKLPDRDVTDWANPPDWLTAGDE